VRDTLMRLCVWLAAPGHAGGAGDPLDWEKAAALLHENTRALFGPRPAGRHVYFRVTAPDAAEANPALAAVVVVAGTDVLRINGAHESPRPWEAIASVLRAHAKTGRVIVDLPGRRLRAEIRQLEPAVIHLPRHKDRLGRSLIPTQVQTGDVLDLTGAGGRPRALVVRASGEFGVLAECDHSLYVTSGLPLVWRRGRAVFEAGRVGALPLQPRA
jgi:pyruvate kinase